jgi:phosphoglycolate phosphatase
MFSLVVFDLDGTLVDSQRDIAEAANDLLVSCGGRPLLEHAIAQMVGDGAALLVARAFAAAAIEAPPDALDRFLDLYDRRLLKYTRPYDGVGELLEELGRRGTSLAVLTNKPLGATRQILAGLDLARHFPEDAVLGGDGPFPRKPDPAGLLHLTARFEVGVASTLMVGDSVADWRTAQRASTSICLARYGFGYLNFPLTELKGDEHAVDAPLELLRL